MTAERFYGTLLRLYPRAFRREYGDAMIEAFRDMRAAHRRSRVSFWSFVVRDVCRSAARQHVDAAPFPARWMAVCGLGAIVTGLLANAVAWAVAYFYHPYLEGLQIEPWHYGALLGLGLGLVQALALRGRFEFGARWVCMTVASAAIGLQAAAAISAGALGCGLVLGSSVGAGQWFVLRAEGRAAGWRIPASAFALAAAAVSSDAVMRRAFAGVNPLPGELLTASGLAMIPQAAPGMWLAILAMMGLVIGALTARPIALMRAD